MLNPATFAPERKSAASYSTTYSCTGCNCSNLLILIIIDIQVPTYIASRAHTARYSVCSYGLLTTLRQRIIDCSLTGDLFQPVPRRSVNKRIACQWWHRDPRKVHVGVHEEVAGPLLLALWRLSATRQTPRDGRKFRRPVGIQRLTALDI